MNRCEKEDGVGINVIGWSDNEKKDSEVFCIFWCFFCC